MRLRVLFGVASVVAVVGVLWGSVTPAGACTCVPIGPGDPQQVYAQQADSVVLGTVAELVPTRDPYEGLEEDDVDAIVAVARYEKGSGPSEVQVQDGALCGMFQEADVGKTFRLYLSVDGAEVSTSPCLGSEEIAAAVLDEAPAEASVDGVEIQQESDGGVSVGAAIAIAVLGSLAILAVAVFWARRGGRQRMGSE